MSSHQHNNTLFKSDQNASDLKKKKIHRNNEKNNNRHFKQQPDERRKVFKSIKKENSRNSNIFQILEKH